MCHYRVMPKDICELDEPFVSELEEASAVQTPIGAEIVLTAETRRPTREMSLDLIRHLADEAKRRG